MKALFTRFLTLGLLCALPVTFCGCEDDSDTSVPQLDDYESAERSATYTVITVTPPSTSLENNGDQKTFEVRGGTTPYTWEVSDISRGSITLQGQNSFVYQRDTAGDNIITIQDADGNLAFVQITQE